MKKNLMKLGLLAFCFAMMAGMGFATACIDPSFEVGINVTAINAAGGCTFQGLTFNNFAVINASAGVGTAEVDVVAGGITAVGGTLTFNFQPNLGLGTSGGTISDLHFFYTITGNVNGLSMFTGGNGGSVNEIDCKVTQDINGLCPLVSQVWNTTDVSGTGSTCVGNTGTGPGSASCALGLTGTTNLWVFKDISITDPTVSHLTNFTEGFTTTPEPMTLTLMGAGLLGIGMLRRRFQK
jgi:hypothetical protein